MIQVMIGIILAPFALLGIVATGAILYGFCKAAIETYKK